MDTKEAKGRKRFDETDKANIISTLESAKGWREYEDALQSAGVTMRDESRWRKVAGLPPINRTKWKKESIEEELLRDFKDQQENHTDHIGLKVRLIEEYQRSFGFKIRRGCAKLGISPRSFYKRYSPEGPRHFKQTSIADGGNWAKLDVDVPHLPTLAPRSDENVAKARRQKQGLRPSPETWPDAEKLESVIESALKGREREYFVQMRNWTKERHTAFRSLIALAETVHCLRHGGRPSWEEAEFRGHPKPKIPPLTELFPGRLRNALPDLLALIDVELIIDPPSWIRRAGEHLSIDDPLPPGSPPYAFYHVMREFLPREKWSDERLKAQVLKLYHQTALDKDFKKEFGNFLREHTKDLKSSEEIAEEFYNAYGFKITHERIEICSEE